MRNRLAVALGIQIDDRTPIEAIFRKLDHQGRIDQRLIINLLIAACEQLESTEERMKMMFDMIQANSDLLSESKKVTKSKK